MEEMLATGRIRSSHGLAGYVKVKSFSGDTGHLQGIEEMVLSRGSDSVRVTIEDVKPSGPEAFLKFFGIDTPEKARHFAGWVVWIRRSEASPRSNGEYYIADLVGCDVAFGGAVVGCVRSVCETRNDTFLELEKRSNGELVLVPFSEECIGEVDAERKTIDLRSGWMLE